MTNVHLKIMRSFIAAPDVHVAAYSNPDLIGGPFINYDASRVPEIRALMEKTVKEQSQVLALAEALQNLDKMLTSEATGFSLEPMYQRVPEALRGYVELVYDLNNHPSLRVIEGMLYKSRYYCQAAQSVVLSQIDKDDRSFVLSTPRLKEPGCLHLGVSFRDKRLDELFAMKFAPRPFSYIKRTLNVPDSEDCLFSSFFTDEVACPAPRHRDDGVRIRYFGHACLFIESKDTTIMTDPVVSYRLTNGISRYTYADLPENIDYVLITHNHQDHCLFETLLQLRHKIKTVIVPKNNGGGLADPSLKLVLQNVGFDDVKEIDELETIDLRDGMIIGLPFLGEHADLNIRTKTAYYVNLQNRSIIALADSNNLEPRLYDHIHNLVKDVDTVFIGMECHGAPMSWIYGPLLGKPLTRKIDQSRRLNGSDFEKASAIVARLNPKSVYVYAMGQEPWLTQIVAIKYNERSAPIVESNKLVEYCRERGIISERLFGRKEILC
jgi:L-ascorbate metabolism protein UlaG (beta-lactamase superfamily)